MAEAAKAAADAGQRDFWVEVEEIGSRYRLVSRRVASRHVRTVSPAGRRIRSTLCVRSTGATLVVELSQDARLASAAVTQRAAAPDPPPPRGAARHAGTRGCLSDGLSLLSHRRRHRTAARKGGAGGGAAGQRDGAASPPYALISLSIHRPTAAEVHAGRVWDRPPARRVAEAAPARRREVVVDGGDCWAGEVLPRPLVIVPRTHAPFILRVFASASSCGRRPRRGGVVRRVGRRLRVPAHGHEPTAVAHAAASEHRRRPHHRSLTLDIAPPGRRRRRCRARDPQPRAARSTATNSRCARRTPTARRRTAAVARIGLAVARGGGLRRPRRAAAAGGPLV